jgi:hypothetical protein
LIFFIGERLLKKIGIIYQEDLYRVKNSNYEYSFQNNLNTNYAVWGDSYYKLCTDSRGFKFNCTDKEQKNYHIAFIGDSFTEGIGLPFEKTFVGKFKKKSGLAVINLGVASYSPIIYVKKIKYLITNDIISFDHLVVGIDLTDLEDDWNRSKKNIKENTKIKKKNIDLKFFLAKNLPTTYLILKKINWYFKIHISKNTYVDHLDYYKNKSSWSYIKNYNELDKKIKNHISYMEELFFFLREKNIKISVLIYPHQASIKFDQRNSLYKNIWEKYCIDKCYKFIDAYSIFFDMVDKSSKEKVMNMYYINGDPHFNEKGNNIIFEKLIKILK